MIVNRYWPGWATLFVLLSSCGTTLAPGEYWVRSLEIRGNSAVLDRELKRGLVTQETSWWPFADEQPYNESTFELDLQRIQTVYAEQGYHSATIAKHDVHENKEKGSVDIEIRVEEGPPTLISDVTFTDLPTDPQLRNALEKALTMKQGDRFVYERYAENKKSLSKVLAYAGYPYGKVTGDVLVDRKAARATITFHVTAGPAVRFGQAIFRGNEPIPREKIDQLATWTPGDPFSPRELERTENRLASQRVFSSIRLEIPEQPTEQADVIINLTPGRLHELRVGGGVGIENQRHEVRARATWTHYNFFGGLRRLTTEVKPALVAIPTFWNANSWGPAVEARIEFSQPDIFNSRILAFAKLEYELGIEPGYRYHGPEAQLGLERQFFNNHLILGVNWNIELRSFFDYNAETADDIEQLFGTSINETYHPAWLGQTVALDFRDEVFDPRAGFYMITLAEEGLSEVGSNYDYLKVVPEVRGYVPLGTKRLSLALRAQFGRIWLTSGNLSPISRRLDLGGPNSHRGFSYGRLAPQVIDSDSGDYIPVGGNVSLLFSTDLRLRLFKLWSNWLNITGFVDAGDVTIEMSELHLDNLHWASGGSLQYQTPIGSLSFAVGVRLNRLAENAMPANPDPGEQITYHLLLGDAF